MALKSFLAMSACAVALATAATTAHATPYAYASNQITGLTVRYSDGSEFVPQTATTTISDGAQYDGYGLNAGKHQAQGTVGSAVTIDQAYSGPGPEPTSTYSPVGAGSFTGARSNATISGGSAASGGVNVSNVAEAYGTSLSNSNGTNNAAISFQVTGTGKALQLNFNDLYQLIASTSAVPGEIANAQISNSFSITDLSSSRPLARYSPDDINLQISSNSGIPSSNQVGPTQQAFSFLTPILEVGQSYNIALTSIASETTTPGSASPVPEPASMGLLGAGLVAAGLVRRRRKA